MKNSKDDEPEEETLLNAITCFLQLLGSSAVFTLKTASPEGWAGPLPLFAKGWLH